MQCASCTAESDASYILQVQLHNYTNLHGAYYNGTVNKSACCCDSFKLTCKQKAENLDCNANFCRTAFEFCVEERCSEYPQSYYLTDIVTFNGVAAGDDGVTIYSTIEHRGTIKIKVLYHIVKQYKPFELIRFSL